MILREKIILTIIGSIILAITFDSYLNLFFDFNKNKITSSEPDIIINDKDNLIKKIKPVDLSTNSWGNDIFYNRSYKYKNWFNLTGITQFEDGNKAIINGNILHEEDKIKGFTIKKIANNYVILKRNKHIVTLKIKE